MNKQRDLFSNDRPTKPPPPPATEPYWLDVDRLKRLYETLDVPINEYTIGEKHGGPIMSPDQERKLAGALLAWFARDAPLDLLHLAYDWCSFDDQVGFLQEVLTCTQGRIG